MRDSKPIQKYLLYAEGLTLKLNLISMRPAPQGNRKRHWSQSFH